ncbi:MAG: TolC family protein [Rhodospirillaceae bacterium]
MMHRDILQTAVLRGAGRESGRLRSTALSAIRAAAVLALILTPVAVGHAAQPAAAAKPAKAPAAVKPAKAAGPVAIDTMAACPAVAEETASRPAFDLVKRLRAGTEGARLRLRALPVREITRNALVDEVLGRNLNVRSSAESIAIAQAAVTTSDAVFDPTLFSSLSYTNSFTDYRHDVISRWRDVDPNAKLQDDAELLKAQQPGQTLPQLTCLPAVSLDGNVIAPADTSCQSPAVYSVADDLATVNSRSDHKVSGTLGVGMIFAIGGSASASITSNWHKPPFVGGGTPPLTSAAYPSGTVYDPYGWDEKLFWTSSATMSLTMPLPYTKGFGYEGSTSYYSWQIAQAGERRVGWSEKSVRNSTLNDALQAWWDMNRIVQTIRTVVELRAVLDERAASRKRMFDQGLATRYDLAQVEAEQADLAAREEDGWNSLLATSGRLGVLVAGDQRALLLPAGAEALLRQSVVAGDVGLYEQVLTGHPAVKAQEVAWDASKLTLAYAENQDRPDVSFLASFSVSQTDAVFGYSSLPQALSHLTTPDSSNLFVGVRYHLPIGMNASASALDRARIEERQAYDRTRQARRQVVDGIDRALGDLRSAQAVATRSEEDVRLSQCAWDRARDQRDLGLVAEFEVLNKYRDLITARLSAIAARVNVRKAQASLLAAQGSLEQDYVR